MKITDLMKLAAVSATSASIFATPAQAQPNQAEQGPMNPAVAQGYAAAMRERADQLSRQAVYPQQQMQQPDRKEIEQAYIEQELAPALSQIKEDMRGFIFSIRQTEDGDNLVIRTNLMVCDAAAKPQKDKKGKPIPQRPVPLKINVTPPFASTAGTSATEIAPPANGPKQVIQTVAKLAFEQFGPFAQRPDPGATCAPMTFKR